MGNIVESYFHIRDWEMKLYKNFHIGNLLNLYLRSPQFTKEPLSSRYGTRGQQQVPTVEELKVIIDKTKDNETFHLISGAVVSSIAIGFLYLAQTDIYNNTLSLIASSVMGLYALCIDLPAILFSRYTRGKMDKIIKGRHRQIK